MAGIRLTAQNKDLSGAVRSLFIYDRELEASQDNIVLCTSDFYKLKHEGDPQDPFKVIIPCNCQFTIFLRHPNYTEAEQDEVQLFFNDLITSTEGRFYVRCQYGEDLGEIEQEFYGKILPDIGDLTLDEWQTVDITAIDGIAGLKDIEYRPSGYSDLLPEYAIRADFFQTHFTDILTRNDVVEFFQDAIAAFNTSMYTTSAFWTESKSVSGDIFKQVAVRNIWFEQISSSYRKYKSCYEALEDLLRGFVARCIYASGKYHIEQLPYQDNLTLTRYGYKYNGDAIAGTTYGNKSTLNYTTDDNMWALPSPQKRWLTPFKAVELEGAPAFANYINGLNIKASKNGETGYNETFTYEYIIATGNRLVSQLNFNFIQFPAFAGPSQYLFLHFRFKLKIGSYYLRNGSSNDDLWLFPDQQYFVKSDFSIPSLEWSLTDSTITIIWRDVFAEDGAHSCNEKVQYWLNRLSNTSLVFESLEIQEDGVMELEIVDFTAYDENDNVLGSAPYPAITNKTTSRLIIGGSYQDLYEQPKNITIYEVGDINNTYIYKTKIPYYDSSRLLFPMLFIKNSTYTTTHEPTVEWTDPDALLTLPINKLMMQTLLAMRQYPAETFKMDFIFIEKDIFRMDMRVAIDDELYIPLDLEIFGGTGVYKVTLLKVYKDFTGINIINTGDPDISIPFPAPDGGLDSAFPGYPGGGGVQYYEEWTNVSNNYVTVDTLLTLTYGMTENDIKEKIFLFINGVRQRYLDDTLVNRTFKFDTGTNRIYFFKGSGNVAHIEFFRYY